MTSRPAGLARGASVVAAFCRRSARQGSARTYAASFGDLRFDVVFSSIDLNSHHGRDCTSAVNLALIPTDARAGGVLLRAARTRMREGWLTKRPSRRDVPRDSLSRIHTELYIFLNNFIKYSTLLCPRGLQQFI